MFWHSGCEHHIEGVHGCVDDEETGYGDLEDLVTAKPTQPSQHVVVMHGACRRILPN